MQDALFLKLVQNVEGLVLNLNNLQTLDDYTKASKYFISLFFPQFLYNDEVIGRVVYILYKVKINLDKTNSKKRFAYTKKAVITEILKYIKENKPNGVSFTYFIKTPLDILLDKEFSILVNNFIDTLKPKQKQYIELLYNGHTPPEIMHILGVTRQCVHQHINKIQKSWNEYVLEQKKTSKQESKKQSN